MTRTYPGAKVTDGRRVKDGFTQGRVWVRIDGEEEVGFLTWTEAMSHLRESMRDAGVA